MNEMNDTPLDDHRDRMISALYGELDEPDLAALRAAIAEDPGIEAEWRELQTVRNLIRVAEGAPSVPEPATPPKRTVWDLLTAVASTRLAASGLGFAAAASLFIALLVGGLRVDRTPNGLLVRLDGSLASDLAVASALAGGDHNPMDRGVSRAEMLELTRALAGATAARLDELESRQVDSQAEMTRALYDALSINQQQQYADLRNRIERVAYTTAAGPLTGSWGPTEPITRGGMNHDN